MGGIEWRNQQGLQNVLRPQVLQGVLGRAAEIRLAHDELLHGRNIQAEVLAVGNHVEDICPHQGGLPHHSDHGGPFGQYKTPDVFILPDNARVNGPSRGLKIYRCCQRVNVFACGIEPGDQVRKRCFECRWGQLRWLDPCLSPHQAPRGYQECGGKHRASQKLSGFNQSPLRKTVSRQSNKRFDYCQSTRAGHVRTCSVSMRWPLRVPPPRSSQQIAKLD